MGAVGKEGLEISTGICDRIGVGNSNAIETERPGFVDERGFQVLRGKPGKGVQKSRST